MKKAHKIAILSLLSVAAVLFIVLGVWNPCQYALIVPAFIAFIGISYFVVAKINARNENKQKKLAVNA